jgi:phosphoribosylamine--glycine ligase
MWTSSGPKVLEFNVRFGDPETEALMPLVASDLAELLGAAAAGSLPERIDIRPGAAATIVLASSGYPGAYETGARIDGLDAAGSADSAVVFHAGTRADAGHVVTSGGRVLAVTAWGSDLGGSLAAAYDAARAVHFDGMFWRSDIGRRHVAAGETERKNG